MLITLVNKTLPVKLVVIYRNNCFIIFQACYGNY